MTTRAARRRRAYTRLVAVAPARRLAPRIPTTSADVSRGRARRRPHRHRPRAPGPRALRGPAAVPAAAPRSAAQVRPADDAGAGRDAAGPPQRADSLRP